jgi:hypothetical protein
MTSVLQVMRTPLSDSDLKEILGNDLKIIVYSDLSKINNIRQLLTNERDCVVILYEEKKLSGHWTCLTREGDLFTFFDPYGIPVDSQLQWINMFQRYKLNEAVPYLSLLLKNEHYIYNRTNFQQDDSKIQTCGDHVCAFLYCFIHCHMNLEQYQDYMKHLKKLTKQPYDYIVAEFIRDKGR